MDRIQELKFYQPQPELGEVTTNINLLNELFETSIKDGGETSRTLLIFKVIFFFKNLNTKKDTNLTHTLALPMNPGQS